VSCLRDNSRTSDDRLPGASRYTLASGTNRPFPSPGYLKRPRWVHAIRHLGRFSAAALIGLVIPVTQEVDGEINAGLSTGVLDQLRVYAQSVSKQYLPEAGCRHLSPGGCTSIGSVSNAQSVSQKCPESASSFRVSKMDL
jgi:hypothetical protein